MQIQPTLNQPLIDFPSFINSFKLLLNNFPY